MYERFERHFSPDEKPPVGQGSHWTCETSDPKLRELMHRFSGVSFNGGLYRVLNGDTSVWAMEFVARAFPEVANRITCFAYDWLGRIFAIDSARLQDGAQAIVLLEPGSGQALEIPRELVGFHDNELVDNPEAALAENFYLKWLANGGAKPAPKQCVGYKKPLFLGGEDVVEGLHMSDLDVYWALSKEFIAQSRKMPIGARIDSISLNG